MNRDEDLHKLNIIIATIQIIILSYVSFTERYYIFLPIIIILGYVLVRSIEILIRQRKRGNRSEER